MESVTIIKNKVNYTVNYWTELLGVMYIINEDESVKKHGGSERCNKVYRDEVLACFSKYNNHNAVKTLSKLSKEYYFNFDAPVLLFLQLSSDKVCRRSVCKGRRMIERSLFNEFISSVKDFEKETNFEDFYKKHINFYNDCLNEFINDLERFEPIDYLFNVLNVKNRKSLTINLMCGVTSSNYGVFVKNKMYANIRPYYKSKSEERPCFSFKPIYFTTLVLHEFAHSFINDWVEESIKNVDIDVKKYKKILKNFNYGECMYVYIAETIIRAIECLYVLKEFNYGFESYVSEYENEGFVLIRKVIDEIKEFMEGKKEYKKFTKLVDDICLLF